MADADEPQFTSLAARIAALKQNQALDNGSSAAAAKRKPPPPVRPKADSRSRTTNNPPLSSYGSSNSDRQANNEPTKQSDVLIPPVDVQIQKNLPVAIPRVAPPPLPKRTDTSSTLSIRKDSAQMMDRKASSDSMMSQKSTVSSFSMSARSSASSVGDGRKVSVDSGRNFLPTIDQVKSSHMQIKRQEADEVTDQAKQTNPSGKSTRTPPSVLQTITKPTTQVAPPRLPLRQPKHNSVSEDVVEVPTSRTLLPTKPPPQPKRPSTTDSPNHSVALPPPVPRASRPSDDQIEAFKARQSSIASIPPPGRNVCMICRDFSVPDNVAAQYPRSSNPSLSIEYLSRVLCGPFSSPTDKARAIFTWLHLNIDYDTEAFFGNTVAHSTPENTIAKGLAVCGGYAGVYVAIALKAGLECVMVTGHGKGYSYTQPKKGESIPPPNPSGHAWNAVRIDGGEWHLLDSCWGAGHVSEQRYVRRFSPTEFTSSNEDFGLKHFPSDSAHFFRRDRRALTWEEYIIGPTNSEPPQIYNVEDHGISKKSFMPAQGDISVSSGGTTHFQFSKMCPHWNHEKNGQGRPYCMILQLNGLDGRVKDTVPFDSDDTYWWLDVATKHLGCPGQKVTVNAITKVNEEDARGMTKREYLSKKGKPGSMAWMYIATWTLV